MLTKMAKAKPVVIQMNQSSFFGPLFVRGSRSHLATGAASSVSTSNGASENTCDSPALSRRVGMELSFAHGSSPQSARAHLWESQMPARRPMRAAVACRSGSAGRGLPSPPTTKPNRRLPVSPDFRRPSAYRARYRRCASTTSPPRQAHPNSLCSAARSNVHLLQLRSCAEIIAHLVREIVGRSVLKFFACCA